MSEYWFERLDGRLERLDVHMERGNKLFERFIEADDRNTAAFDRNTAAFDRNTAAFDRWEARQDDMREFMRAITLRVERAGREHSREIRRMGDEIVAELREGRAEFRQEMAAQRGALLAILDRLQPGDSGSAA